MDLVGRFPGNIEEDSDAIKAYTQVRLDNLEALLGVTEGKEVQAVTWISLPPSRRPRSWEKIQDPVCILKRNLYGHPLAGLIWEKHCQKSIQAAGFELISGWECLFVHKSKKLFLSVYVDDFRMAGPKEAVSAMWTLLGKTLALEPPVPSHTHTYLGCNQKIITISEKVVKEKTELFARLLTPKSGQSQDSEKDDAAKAELDRSQLKPNPGSSKKSTKKLGSPVAGEPASANQNEPISVPKISGADGKPKGIATPAISNRLVACEPAAASPTFTGPIQAWSYDMAGHAAQCVERYCELADKSVKDLKDVATPCIDDHQLSQEDMDTKGTLEKVAARIVLKVLYLARMGRPDVLWSVNTLARKVTKWNSGCDKRTLRLISYLHKTQNWGQVCFVGDHPADCWLALFCDASFAGDLEDSKSTSGAYLCVVGPRTFVPITWVCKRQGAVSHSSTEAEVIALEAALRMDGLPSLMLWELILEVYGNKKISPKMQTQTRCNAACEPAWPAQDPDPMIQVLLNVDYVPCTLPPSLGTGRIVIFEDNDAVIKMIIKGRSPNMRHVPRTHRVDLDWLFERVRTDPGVFVRYVGTKEQIGDLFTKGAFTADAWWRLCRLAQIGDISSFVGSK